MVLTFEQSGSSVDFGLKEVRELALQHGFVRNGAGAPQPDLDALFGAYGCKALSMFKKKFCAERLSPPGGVAAAASQPPLKGFKVSRRGAHGRQRALTDQPGWRGGRSRAPPRLPDLPR